MPYVLKMQLGQGRLKPLTPTSNGRISLNRGKVLQKDSSMINNLEIDTEFKGDATMKSLRPISGTSLLGKDPSKARIPDPVY